MAKITEHNLTPILGAVEHWKNNCFMGNGSVFTNEAIWDATYFGEFIQNFVENPQEDKRSFYEKLEYQLMPASPETKRLTAEMLWFMFLFPSNYKHQTKRDAVVRVWNWSGSDLDTSHELLNKPLKEGIGSCGQAYSNYRWAELTFFIRLLEAWSRLDDSKKQELITSPWEFGAWLDGIPDADKRQFRHLLLYLLFPDFYERISSKNNKFQIAGSFTDELKVEDTKGLISADDSDLMKIDKQLYKIREIMSNKLNRKDIDFYWSPLVERWAEEKPESRPIRYWVEKTIVKNRPDREKGEFALGNALWSPQKSKDQRDIYSNMRKVRPGDVILHFVDNKHLAGISQVESKVDTEFIGLPNTDWADMPGYLVQLKGYEELKPTLKREEIFGEEKNKKALANILSDNRSMFFNRKLELNQGAYLTKAPKDLIDLLAAIYYSKHRKNLPYIDSEEVDTPPTEAPVPYTLESALRDLFISKDNYQDMVTLFRLKKNLILQGPPGTGKTYIAQRLAFTLLEEKDFSRVQMVQFHQSFSYEDFIQGFRPDHEGNFSIKNGVFYNFCRLAESDSEKDYVFIIDEINRGNLSKIFGEVMMLIESDKRSRDWAVQLTYSKLSDELFYIPDNLYILGMMNTADRSIALVDYALRRRFAFVDLKPAFTQESYRSFLVKKGVSSQLIQHIISKISGLNKRISEDRDLGPGFNIGHSYFCPQNDDESADVDWYRSIIRTEVGPLLREYWFDKPSEELDDMIDDLMTGI